MNFLGFLFTIYVFVVVVAIVVLKVHYQGLVNYRESQKKRLNIIVIIMGAIVHDTLIDVCILLKRAKSFIFFIEFYTYLHNNMLACV